MKVTSRAPLVIGLAITLGGTVALNAQANDSTKARSNTRKAQNVRKDSSNQSSAARPGRAGYGRFYWGLAGGGSVPRSTLNKFYTLGYNGTIPIGWDASDKPVGLRADIGYDRVMGRTSAGVSNSLAIWSGNLDVKIRYPLDFVSPRAQFYLLGGGGVARIVGYGSGSTTTTYSTGGSGGGGNGGGNGGGGSGGGGSGGGYDVVTGAQATATNGMATSFGSAKNEFIWNAGAGVSYAVGHHKLFFESRYLNVDSNGPLGTTRFIPFILGIQF